MSKPFVSYLRVSTNRQGISGLGLEAQRDAVAGYLRRVDGLLIEEVVEVESGTVKSRSGLTKAIAMCRETGACLVVAKLDRLARNVAFVSTLMETGTEFVAVDAPFANRLLIHVLSAFAEHEREQISLRTKSALAAAKARGVKLGVNGAVLGIERKLAASAFAKSLSPIIEEVRAGGAHTLNDIAVALDTRGVSTREGCRWSPTAVRRVLLRLNDGA